VKNAHLLIQGKEVCQWNIEDFQDFRKMNDWEQAVYEKVDEIYGQNNGINTLAQAFDEEFAEKWYMHRNTLIRAEEMNRKMAEPIEIEGRTYRKIKIFKVYHSGWECDSEGFVVTDGYRYHLVLTNHGQPYLATVEEAQKLMNNYRQAIEDTQYALNLLATEN
jgi:hypothetical protein